MPAVSQERKRLTFMVQKWELTFPAFTGNETRKAYVYLPTMYEKQPRRKFPVLYMFDGHNLFFNEDATYGKSWGLADYLDYTDTPLIVAAIECNTSPDYGRLSEYSPYDFYDPMLKRQFIGYGKDTMDWYVKVFKPMIDQKFRTLKGRKHTFIGGSSMGGLMSLYAVTQYNRIFSRAMALSPSLWVESNALLKTIQTTHIRPKTTVYMDYGSEELRDFDVTIPGLRDVYGALLERGVYLNARIAPGGTHSEASWEKQLPFAMQTLMHQLGG